MSGTRRAGALLLAAALSAPPAQAAAPRQAPPPAPAAQGGTFRSGVDLVALNVTVTDPSNRFVTDLGAEDFTVLEDGVKQEIGYFSRTNLSLSVSLLLDSSASMDDKMRTTQAAALGFIRSLRPQDEAQVIDFDSRVTVIAPFTSSKPQLEKAVSSIIAGGSTSLFTAIYIALNELRKVASKGAIEDLRRQAVIVLSDGEDTSSLVGYEEVLELAKRSQTAVYAIGIRTREPGTGRGSGGESDYALRQLTTQTGGRVFFPVTADELAPIYALISQELSSQYLIGYTSSNPKRDGAWRRIAVRTARAGASARTRMGYYAPGG